MKAEDKAFILKQISDLLDQVGDGVESPYAYFKLRDLSTSLWQTPAVLDIVQYEGRMTPYYTLTKYDPEHPEFEVSAKTNQEGRSRSGAVTYDSEGNKTYSVSWENGALSRQTWDKQKRLIEDYRRAATEPNTQEQAEEAHSKWNSKGQRVYTASLHGNTQESVVYGGKRGALSSVSIHTYKTAEEVFSGNRIAYSGGYSLIHDPKRDLFFVPYSCIYKPLTREEAMKRWPTTRPGKRAAIFSEAIAKSKETQNG